MDTATMTIAERLAYVFGREWLQLTPQDQALIIRDCIEDGGLEDFGQYRRNIGVHNLEAYARVMRVRFEKAQVR